MAQASHRLLAPPPTPPTPTPHTPGLQLHESSITVEHSEAPCPLFPPTGVISNRKDDWKDCLARLPPPPTLTRLVVNTNVPGDGTTGTCQTKSNPRPKEARFLVGLNNRTGEEWSIVFF